LQNLDYEVLDLGLVYYKNIIKNPQQLIKDIEDLDRDYTLSPSIAPHTEVKPWIAWRNDSNGTNEIFCWQKFIPQVKHVSESDYFRDRQIDISSQLFGALDQTLEHYSNQIYPFAAKNIKSRERTMHLLRYDKSGYLPAHQDQGVSTRVLSVLLYLNDDYEGGEITFRHSGLTFKPEPGSVLFFPSNFLYVHEVAPITKGPRYALPNWYHNVTEKYSRNSTGEE
jgi:Rps23 Pro-64 3,4-dihydroxylase Tpa1-like proline 4-hydroxylase